MYIMQRGQAEEEEEGEREDNKREWGGGHA